MLIHLQYNFCWYYHLKPRLHFETPSCTDRFDEQYVIVNDVAKQCHVFSKMSLERIVFYEARSLACYLSVTRSVLIPISPMNKIFSKDLWIENYYWFASIGQEYEFEGTEEKGGVITYKLFAAPFFTCFSCSIDCLGSLLVWQEEK